jgi:uncharacterized Zn finger protein (UPF0148 family)
MTMETPMCPLGRTLLVFNDGYWECPSCGYRVPDSETEQEEDE